jgi:hypothetical protein
MVGCATYTPASYSLQDLIGVWEGSYINASQGETGLTLNVYMEGEKCKAIFHFYNLPGRTNAAEGRYYMNVSFDKSKYFLNWYEWIENPAGYIYGDMEGTIRGDIFNGSIIVQGYGGNITFRLVRK